MDSKIVKDIPVRIFMVVTKTVGNYGQFTFYHNIKMNLFIGENFTKSKN